MKKQVLTLLAIPFLLASCGTSSNISSAPSSKTGNKSSEAHKHVKAINTALDDCIDLNGEKLDKSYFAGKLTLINVWGTYCGPCKEEMPALGYLYNKFSKDFPFQILGLVIDVQDEQGDIDATQKTKAERLLNTAKCTYQNIVITPSWYSWINTIQYVPTSVFIDDTGYSVDEEIIGSMPTSKWESYIEGFLFDYFD